MGKNEVQRREKEQQFVFHMRVVLKGVVLLCPQSPDVVLRRGTFPHRQ